jgi:uncharacterized protein (TIGR02444 family)
VSAATGADLWRWAAASYARPAVAEACLALQDAHGQNTCLLLWAAWARTTEEDEAAAAADLARTWDGAAVRPLREARRAIKAPVAGIADAARLALREGIKAVELEAERMLLEALAALTLSRGQATILASLMAASRAWGTQAPDNALAALAAALD